MFRTCRYWTVGDKNLILRNSRMTQPLRYTIQKDPDHRRPAFY